MVNPSARTEESRTRDRILRLVSADGPVTTAQLVADLGLTETAVRRHIDNLEGEGLIESREATRDGRRGRPARAWVLGPTGHTALTSDYDHLAEAAVDFIRRTSGDAGVTAFAQERVHQLEERYAGLLDEAGDDPIRRAEALADALSTEGYAATVRPVGSTGATSVLTGVQVCQGHCPVQHVATEFPQFCDAETEAFGRLLGVHVQRLATLAHGDHVCTTFVPTAATPRDLPTPAIPQKGSTP